MFTENSLLEGPPDNGVVASLLVKNAPASTSYSFKATPGLNATALVENVPLSLIIFPRIALKINVLTLAVIAYVAV